MFLPNRFLIIDKNIFDTFQWEKVIDIKSIANLSKICYTVIGLLLILIFPILKILNNYINEFLKKEVYLWKRKIRH
jgi:hypothetical protein